MTAASSDAHALARPLGRLMDELRKEGLTLGAEDYVSAWALIGAYVDGLSIAADGPEERPLGLGDFRDSLRPLLARDRESGAPFDRAFDRVLRDARPTGPTTAEEEEAQRPAAARLAAKLAQARRTRLVRISSAICALVASLVLLAVVVALRQHQTSPPTLQPRVPGTVRPAAGAPVDKPVAQPAVPPIAEPTDGLARMQNAAADFGGAPTLAELADELARTSPVGWPAERYLATLQARTGYARHTPIMIGGRGQDDAAAPGERRHLAWLAHAIGAIERPAAEPSAAATMADPALVRSGGEAVDVARRILAGAPQSFAGADPAAAVARIRQRTRSRASDDILLRAASLLGFESTGTMPWSPEPVPVVTAPGWAKAAAALVPLLILVLWAMRRFGGDTLALRLRPPNSSPLRTPFIAAALRQVPQTIPGRRELRRLQARSRRPTTLLDIGATVSATLASGGWAVQPRYATSHVPAEYLILIDRRSVHDQDARRALALFEPFLGQVAVVIYYFQSDPGRLQSADGQWTALEAVANAVPDRRLIVIGDVDGLIDPLTLRLTPAAEQLKQWQRRALLTPRLVEEWTREELEVSRQLDIPLGRATREGVLAIPGLLRLDGRSRNRIPRPELETAPPLPPELDGMSIGWLSPHPPEPGERTALMTILRRYLGPAGFDWLCAVAFYPALQWNLTMFLGMKLPRRQDKPDGHRLYDDATLANLTRLPWFRRGAMPAWLRRDLIAATQPDRARDVRLLVAKLLSEADQAAETTGTAQHGASFVISRESDVLPPGALVEDEVFLDQVVRPNPEDFRLPRGMGQIARTLPAAARGVAWQEWAASLLIAAAVGLAGWTAPGGGAPLVDGALLALGLAMLGVVAAAALYASAPADRLQGLLSFLAPTAATIAVIAIASLPATLVGESWRRTVVTLMPAPDLVGGWRVIAAQFAIPPVAHLVCRRFGTGFPLPRLAAAAFVALAAEAAIAVTAALALVGPAAGGGTRLLSLAAAAGLIVIAAAATRRPLRVVQRDFTPLRRSRSATVAGVALVALALAAFGGSAWLRLRPLSSASVAAEALGDPALLAATPDRAVIASGDVRGRVRLIVGGSGTVQVGSAVLAMRACAGAAGTRLVVLTDDGRLAMLPAIGGRFAPGTVSETVDLTAYDQIPAVSCAPPLIAPAPQRADPERVSRAAAVPLRDQARRPPRKIRATKRPKGRRKPAGTIAPLGKSAPVTRMPYPKASKMPDRARPSALPDLRTN